MTRSAGRGSIRPGQAALPVGHLEQSLPGLTDHLRRLGVPVEGNQDASLAYLCEEAGLDPADVLAWLAESHAPPSQPMTVGRIDILGGHGKDGGPEPVGRLGLEPGQALAVVGATGSGKSQLLADVESLAQGDSPSGRIVLVDGLPPPEDWRWSPSNRPVAQVSQGMRFLLDIPVGEFVALHAAARAVANPDGLSLAVVDAACELCGEPFTAATELATLSGGQSRALMIADAAMISASPIILVDEIENAGIDRERALRFLVGQGKICLLATHDPLLALRADRRVVLRNGAMTEVLAHSEDEQAALTWLEEQDRAVWHMREQLRAGQRIAR